MKYLVIAPHADDETIGVGGSILKHIHEGHEVHWVLVTAHHGRNRDEIQNRLNKLQEFANLNAFESSHYLEFAPAKLTHSLVPDLISNFAEIFKMIRPEVIYLPFPGDIHSDHEICFKSAISASKVFRAPFIRETRVYETLSETNFSLDPRYVTFRPNLYIDISKQFEKKLKMVEFYGAEFEKHPFPRSMESIKSLGTLRGAEANCVYAEAFQILKKIES